MKYIIAIIAILTVGYFLYNPERIENPKVIYSQSDVALGANEVDCNWITNITDDYNEIVALLKITNEKILDGSIVIPMPIQSKCNPMTKRDYLGFKALNNVLTAEEKAKTMKQWQREKLNISFPEDGLLGAGDEPTLGDYIEQALTIELTTV